MPTGRYNIVIWDMKYVHKKWLFKSSQLVFWFPAIWSETLQYQEHLFIDGYVSEVVFLVNLIRSFLYISMSPKFTLYEYIICSKHSSRSTLPLTVTPYPSLWLDKTVWKSTRIPHKRWVTGNCSIIDSPLYSKGKRSAGKPKHSIILCPMITLL